MFSVFKCLKFYGSVDSYAINVVFYLHLRARRIPVASHPVVRRLLQYRDLLEKLKPLEEVAEKQIDDVLEQEAAGKLPVASKEEYVFFPPHYLNFLSLFNYDNCFYYNFFLIGIRLIFHVLLISHSTRGITFKLFFLYL